MLFDVLESRLVGIDNAVQELWWYLRGASVAVFVYTTRRIPRALQR
jgi:hypothetical protein